MNNTVFIATLLLVIALNQVTCRPTNESKPLRYSKYPSHKSEYPSHKSEYPSRVTAYPSDYPKQYSYHESSEPEPIFAFGHLGFWETDKILQTPIFKGLGFVFFYQESEDSPLEIEFKLEKGFKADRKYIFQFHERSVTDHFVSASYITEQDDGEDNADKKTAIHENQLTDRCLFFAGNRFSGLDAGVNYDLNGDVGLLEVENDKIEKEFNDISKFTLFGKDSILGRSFVVFESIDLVAVEPTERNPLDLRLPLNMDRVYGCSSIGIDIDMERTMPRMTSEVQKSVSSKKSKKSYRYSSAKYKSEDHCSRVALAIIGGSNAGLRDLADSWGLILFEQENSKAPMNVTGMFTYNKMGMDKKLAMTVRTGSVNEGFSESSVQDRCAKSGEVFQEHFGLLGGAELPLDFHGGDKFRGVEFSFIEYNYSLFGPDSILGRSITFMPASESYEILNCATIGVYTPGNEMYDALVMNYLRRPEDQRLFRDSAYTVFRQYIANAFPYDLPDPLSQSSADALINLRDLNEIFGNSLDDFEQFVTVNDAIEYLISNI